MVVKYLIQYETSLQHTNLISTKHCSRAAFSQCDVFYVLLYTDTTCETAKIIHRAHGCSHHEILG